MYFRCFKVHRHPDYECCFKIAAGGRGQKGLHVNTGHLAHSRSFHCFSCHGFSLTTTRLSKYFIFIFTIVGQEMQDGAGAEREEDDLIN